MSAAAGIAALAAGAGMFSAALPMAAASLAGIAGDTALDELRDERPTRAAAERLLRSRERAVAWRDTGRAWSDIALGRLIQAGLGDPARRDQNLAAAETAAARGVALAPANHYGWMRLVQLRAIQDRADEALAGPLRLALLSGPREQRRDALLLLTVEAGLRAWTHLGADERRLIADKARVAWRRNAAAAARVAARAGATTRLGAIIGLTR